MTQRIHNSPAATRRVYAQRQVCSLLTLLVLGAFMSAAAVAAPASDLSRWLSREALPDIANLLAEHPRYLGQRIQLQAASDDALSEAIVTVVGGNLSDVEGVTLFNSTLSTRWDSALAGSVDDLTCQSVPDFDYLLQVTVRRDGSSRGQVQLALLEAVSGMPLAQQWFWQGRFSGAERDSLKRDATVARANGSLDAPWSAADVDAAAATLSRDFACALRPQITTRLGLEWRNDLELPAVFADTANATRHRLGYIKELGLDDPEPAYSLDFRIERFRDDVWQLWLVGSPRGAGLAPVQAVTYFSAHAERSFEPTPGPIATAPRPKPQVVSQPAVEPAPPSRPKDSGPALDYFDVQMLDATQTSGGRSRVDLLVTLRIANRSEWPIAYAFTLSGGHFEHCVASPGYYRHDRYGLLSGSLPGGTTEVRRLVIENARHRPAPLFGVPRCAGFRDLQGFEDYASAGYKVTDYVRWDR